MSKLTKFLKAHYKTKKDTELPSTHTRIANAENNIKGGNYCIRDDDLDTFYDLVYDEVITGGVMEYLTESQNSTCGAVYIDLDFHYSTEIITRQHSQDWVEDFVSAYLKTVAKYYVLKGPITTYVSQRDGVNRLSDKTKDGIHILFDFAMDRRIQQAVRTDFLKTQVELWKELPLINTPDKVFDEGINKGTTNLTVYGCRKPLHEPYKLVRIANFELDPTDNEFMILDEEIEMTRELFDQLSVQTTFRCSFHTTELGYDILNPVEKLERENDKKLYVNVNTGNEEKNTPENLKKLFECFTIERLDNYETWSKIAWATYNSLGQEGKQILIDANERIPSRNTVGEKIKVEDFYDKITEKKDGLTWGSLHYWARDDNPELYSKYFPKIVHAGDIIYLFKECSKYGNSVDIAKYFVEKYKGEFKCSDIKNRIYYRFTNSLWVKDEGGSSIRLYLSNECVKPFQERMAVIEKYLKMGELSEESFKKFLEEKKNILKCINMLSNSGSLDSILKDITDRILDTSFESIMNKAHYILPIKNGKKIDIRTLDITDRTIDDIFNYECNIEWSEDPLTQEQIEECDKYFGDLFRGRMDTAQVVLDLIKSSLTGKPLRHIIFPYGSGRNGKSVLLNLLRACFTSGVKVISKDVLLKKMGGSISTELEKLDKCRIGYTTELKEEDKLNEQNIKAISGGDEMDVRPLFKTNCEIKPTCTLWAITNELPTFKVEQAILDRLIIIPFKNRFDVVADFEEKIIEKRSIFFRYILQKGNIHANFEGRLTDEMMTAKQEYTDENKDTNLEDFISSNYERTSGKKVLRDDFINQFNMWFRTTYPNSKLPDRSTTKFVRDMTAIGIQNKKSNGKLYFLDLEVRLYDPNQPTGEDDMTDDENSV
jgi:P4 family phage/plasmid primase-like protien